MLKKFSEILNSIHIFIDQRQNVSHQKYFFSKNNFGKNTSQNNLIV